MRWSGCFHPSADHFVSNWFVLPWAADQIAGQCFSINSRCCSSPAMKCYKAVLCWAHVQRRCNVHWLMPAAVHSSYANPSSIIYAIMSVGVSVQWCEAFCSTCCCSAYNCYPSIHNRTWGTHAASTNVQAFHDCERLLRRAAMQVLGVWEQWPGEASAGSIADVSEQLHATPRIAHPATPNGWTPNGCKPLHLGCGKFALSIWCSRYAFNALPSES